MLLELEKDKIILAGVLKDTKQINVFKNLHRIVHRLHKGRDNRDDIALLKEYNFLCSGNYKAWRLFQFMDYDYKELYTRKFYDNDDRYKNFLLLLTKGGF